MSCWLLAKASYGSAKPAPNTLVSESFCLGHLQLVEFVLLNRPKSCDDQVVATSNIEAVYALQMTTYHPKIYFSLSNPAFFLSFLSPSANHLLASTSCTTLTYCLKAMTGKLITQRTQGTVLSILLARAISIAAAEKGEAKKAEGLGTAGEPGMRVSGSPPLTGRRAGVMVGEEKQRR
jgi:hypothetical protein